ncbi:MAG TPA: 50S ribosomal protein L4 [Chitinophagaceae bacterium]|nr:50S ribosomal protein L4 [Chitinophagaceae bacterium]
MELEILSIEGKKTGRSVELPDGIFGIEPNDHAIWLAVKHYLAGLRQGTHRVKNRKEVKGSSRKLHKQKGTGGSRKGNIRNPLYKGGGTIFGPKPHTYDFKLNRKVRDLAKVSALSYKAKAGMITIVEELELEIPKTSQFTAMLQQLGIHPRNKKTLFVASSLPEPLYLSLRNLSSVNGIALSDINTYDIMNADHLVFTESAAKLLMGEEEPAAEEAPAGKA